MRFKTLQQILQLYFVTGLILTFYGCSPVDLVIDYDKNVNFDEFKTYSTMPWPKENSTLINEIDKARIIKAVEHEMEKRGYKKLEENGDLSVNVLVVLEKKTATRAYTDHYATGPYSYYGYGYGFGFGTSTTHFSAYDYWKGTLILDIFSHQTKQLIWQGAAVGTVEENVKKREKAINKTVEVLFNRYPKQKVKSK